MDFQSFSEAISASQSKKWSPRQKHLDALDRALYGEMYDHIKSPFSREYPGRNDQRRISLDDRRASVQYQLPMMIARDLSTRVFGESGRPAILARVDEYTNAWVQAFIEDTNIWYTYIDASWQSSVGAACIVTRVLAEENEGDGEDVDTNAPGRFYHEVWPAVECQPVFKRTAPNKLLELTRTYFIDREQLAGDGYDVEAIDRKWADRKFGRTKVQKRISNYARNQQTPKTQEWVMRCIINARTEAWFEPIPKWLFELEEFDDQKDWDLDEERTFDHELGEVPAVWIRALPTRHSKFPDGASTFEAAIDYQFRIDRTLSQIGRAFDYVGDPQLALKRGSGGSGDFGEPDTDIGATASDVVDIEPDGDAKFLEIRGEGLQIAIDSYVASLRRLAREVSAASRIDPESSPREMSGVAMRMLEHALFGVVGILRVSQGDMGLIPHIRMCLRIAERIKVELPSLAAKLEESAIASGEINPGAALEVQWPPLPEPSGADKLAEVQSIMLAANPATGAPGISQETKVANLAPMYDVRDSVKELSAIVSETDEKQQNDLQIADQQAAIAAKHSKPPSA